jgi:hypothetical protein
VLPDDHAISQSLKVQNAAVDARRIGNGAGGRDKPDEITLLEPAGFPYVHDASMMIGFTNMRNGPGKCKESAS